METRKGRLPHQLPAGRHGLPRSYVLTNQRERILASVVEVVSETGYAGLTVRDVIEHAGVSRRTFYEHFSNKEDVFLATYEAVVDVLVNEVRLSYARGRTYAGRVALGLATFLGLLAGQPALAHVCIVEVMAAGPNALARRAQSIRLFCDLIRPPDDMAAGAPPLAVEVVVGGIYEIVSAHVSRGEADRLLELYPELLENLLLPFVGPRRAAAEGRAASERGASKLEAPYPVRPQRPGAPEAQPLSRRATPGRP
jgi:AcrR family transcriptional regulator